MISRAGQVGRACATGLRVVVQLVLALALLLGAAAGLLAWRLSSAPLDLPWVARQLTALANGKLPVRIEIGGAELVWEGFRAGQDAPIDLRLRDLVVRDSSGQAMAAIPHARAVLSARWLLQGRVVPWTVTLEDASVQVIRQPDGSIAWGFAGGAMQGGAAPPTLSPAAMLRRLRQPADAAAPAATMGDLLSEVRHIGLHHASLRLDDRFMGAVWEVRDLAVDLQRPDNGDPTGTVQGTVALGDQTAGVTVQATLGTASGRTNVTAAVSAFNPARLAAVLPAAQQLAAVDAPVTLGATVQFTTDFQPAALSGRVQLGDGAIGFASTHVPLRGADATVYGTPEHLQIKLDRLEVQPATAAAPSILQGNADFTRSASGGYHGDIAVDLDHLTFADLPSIWPDGVGGGGRAWVLQNIPTGTLHDGHVQAALDLPADLSDATLSKLDVAIIGNDVTIWWLRPVPPVEKVTAKLTMQGPDALNIDVSSGRQTGGVAGGLQVQSGRLVISGLTGPEQFADVQVQTAGAVPDVVALLRHPRLHLLDRSPIRLDDATGQIAGQIAVTHLPMRDAVTMDDVQLRSTAKLNDVHIPGLAGGHDVDHADATLEATTAGITVSGTAAVAYTPADFKFAMDFRRGPPTQALQTVTATGTADVHQFKALGLDLDGYVKGAAALTTTYTQLRNGQADIALRGDLRHAELTLAKLSYTKPADEAATLDAHLLLDGGKLTGIDRLRLDGPTLHVDADATFAGGKPATVRLRKLVLGHDVDAKGDIRLPLAPGEPYVVQIAGHSLDASAPLHRAPAEPQRIDFGPKGEVLPKPPPPPGPPYRVLATLDRLVLADHNAVNDVTLQVENDGRITKSAHLAGRTGSAGAGAFQFDIAPRAGQRLLSGHATDAGALLRSAGVVETMTGGALSVTGTYDDTRADHRLSGTVELTDYRLRKAPILARLLQAMTLYGLLEVAQGSGLGFSKAVLPFHLADDTLELVDARTYSPSLGMTAKGSIDLALNTANLQGTVVPAYFFNSLLGNVPLIGQLFSPERGGGLLAAQFAVRGNLDDPDVSVNPLSALTPGFLRSIFGDLPDSQGAAAPGRPAVPNDPAQPAPKRPH